MKVSELSGSLLDAWVGEAENLKTKLYRCLDETIGMVWLDEHPFGNPRWHPSTNWEQCGPLLEKYKLCVGESEGTWECRAADDDYKSSLWAMRRGSDACEASGDTALQAICRVVVMMKFGETVPDSINTVR